MNAAPGFGFVRGLIFLPSSLKTTLLMFAPDTRALNARATQPVGARSLAEPGTTFSPNTICSYWETEALGWPPDDVPDVLAMTAEPPLNMSARARNEVTRRGLRRPRAERCPRDACAVARRFSSSSSR